MSDKTKCSACGVELIYHLGIEGTCKENLKLRKHSDLLTYELLQEKQKVSKLKDTVVLGGTLLASANNDIANLDEYTDEIESDNAKLRKRLNTIGAKCGGQGNRIKKLEALLQNIIDARIKQGVVLLADVIPEINKAMKEKK